MSLLIHPQQQTVVQETPQNQQPPNQPNNPNILTIYKQSGFQETPQNQNKDQNTSSMLKKSVVVQKSSTNQPSGWSRFLDVVFASAIRIVIMPLFFMKAILRAVFVFLTINGFFRTCDVFRGHKVLLDFAKGWQNIKSIFEEEIHTMACPNYCSRSKSAIKAAISLFKPHPVLKEHNSSLVWKLLGNNMIDGRCPCKRPKPVPMIPSEAQQSFKESTLKLPNDQ